MAAAPSEGFAQVEVQRAREACAAAYEAFKAGDVDTMMQYYAPGVEVTTPLNLHLAGDADKSDLKIIGRDKLSGTVAQWFEMFTMDQMDVDLLMADGSASKEGVAVVALIREGATVKKTGRSWKDNRMAHVMLVRDGLIVKFDEYSDPAMVADVCHAEGSTATAAAKAVD